MRYKEFSVTDILNEIAMNPNSLQREAAKINALAGCEFEMYVPNAAEAEYDSANKITDYMRRNKYINTVALKNALVDKWDKI